MKQKIFLIAAITMVIIIVIVSCETKVTTTESSKPVSNDSLVKHGEYLVSLAGCNDCHSPKKMGPKGPEIDMERQLSGYPSQRPMPAFDSNLVKKGIMQFNEDLTAAAGPWGVSFAANITSDETGIGNWSEEQFRKAITQGKWKGMDGSRTLLPPMPWQELSRLKDEDVKAIFAYLKSTKPVNNMEPAIRQLSDLK